MDEHHLGFRPCLMWIDHPVPDRLSWLMISGGGWFRMSCAGVRGRSPATSSKLCPQWPNAAAPNTRCGRRHQPNSWIERGLPSQATISLPEARVIGEVAA
jgi:hypothetical protein